MLVIFHLVARLHCISYSVDENQAFHIGLLSFRPRGGSAREDRVLCVENDRRLVLQPNHHSYPYGILYSADPWLPNASNRGMPLGISNDQRQQLARIGYET